MRFRLRACTVFSTLSIAVLGAAHAQETSAGPFLLASADDEDQRNRVTITATRTEKDVDDVPATVTVVTAERIENELVTNIKDLVRFEPGVSVRNSPARFSAALPPATGRDGNSGFNIRGLEGNRVLIQVDGVRVPDAYSFGPQATGRGGYVDLDLLKSVEIVRGPASALYGSDGVAGAVSFITRDPEDLIKDGRAFGVRARTAYASADESWANGAIGAAKAGDWSALLAYTRRDAHEQDNQGEVGGEGETRTRPNPTDHQSDSWLAKLVWTPGDTHRFRLTYEGLESETVTEVLSGRGTSPFTGQSTLDLDGEDTARRERVAFDHIFNLGGFLTRGQWSVYIQESETRQFTFEDRSPAADRTRDNTFDTSVWGASGQLEAKATTGIAEHHILLGADWSETEQSNIRNGTIPPAGETFPVRASPLTEYTLAGVFLQDEISLLDGALLLYPALRYDAYELNPIRDALYPANFPAEPSDGDQVSPKIGLVAWPVGWLGAYANYAQGFKAPAPGQVNEGFENLMFGYTTIANPDLKPESSESAEIGLRLRDIDFAGGRWSGSVAAYASDYEDFIVNQAISGTGAPGDPLVFQYINLTAVSVDGVEAQLNAAWDNGLGLRLAASSSTGEVKGTPNTPLESIDPAQLVAGLTYDDPQGRFGGQLIATFVDGKDADDVPSATAFRPPSFSIIDLTAYWNITDWAALRVGAFNLTDEKYWWWSDVRGLSSSAISRDAYTQPGRNYSASLTFRY